MNVLRIFGWSFAISLLGLVAGYVYGGPSALLLVAVLCLLEVSLSFDNAIVNAKVLERMSPFWQRGFLTIGVLIAVFGMRLIFPLVIVAVTAGLGPVEAIDLALEKGDPSTPGTYGYILNDAQPAIGAFGGMFLLMLFLSFVFDERELLWLRVIERLLQRLGKLESASTIVALIVLVVIAMTLAEEPATVFLYGIVGIATYLLVNALGNLFEQESEHQSGVSKAAIATGKAGFFLFLYLEVLDASFSFDGVIGAFAITSDPIIIAIGLGVGAMYIRSLTIFFVRRGTLQEFEYLEHGAMWAVGALAVILLLSVSVHIPELVTGLIGVCFIGAGWLSSIVRARRQASEVEQEPDLTPTP